MAGSDPRTGDTTIPDDPVADVRITDVEAEQRYEATIDGNLAGVIEYVVKHGRIALVHTEVLPAFEGMGVASELIGFAIDDARRRGLLVIATCPFVRTYVERHPETHDIIVGWRTLPG
jgi:predicted GNAT family acetyltransferase